MSDASLELTGANLIAGRESQVGDTTFAAVDPRTRTEGAVRFHEAADDEIGAAAAAAAEAAGQLARVHQGRIAILLRAAAEEIEALGDELIERADLETALGESRLVGERARTCAQLRGFADLVESGRHWEAIIDHPDPQAVPPRPALRRMLLPLGPVAVFGASNFPFAFSVPGGDTAAALAAGCPVIAKAHPSHPGTCELAGRAITAAVRRVEFPAGTFSMVQGRTPAVGERLVLAPEIKAVGFTGSHAGGRALHDLAAGRPEPIPVYAEMGSLNPVFVSAAAAAARAEEIAEGYVGSVTLGVGQFCTKPGLLFVPDDEHGAALEEAVRRRLEDHEPGVLLNAGIHGALLERLEQTRTLDGVRVLVAGGPADEPGCAMSPALFAVDYDTWAATPELSEEHFGPAAIVVRTPVDRMLEATQALPGSLTAAIHGEADEGPTLRELAIALRDRAGRLIWNGYPTGVAVCPAQHHGGPYPATTNAGHTSVGATAIRRFQRPVAYQNAPDDLLPPVLQDANPLAVPRLVEGEWTREPITGGGGST